MNIKSKHAGQGLTRQQEDIKDHMIWSFLLGHLPSCWNDKAYTLSHERVKEFIRNPKSTRNELE